MRRLMVAIAAAIASALILAVAIAGAESPTVTVENASSVSYTSARAKGTVDPKGKEANCHFESVSQAQLEENLTNSFPEFEFATWTDCSGNPHTGTGSQNVEAELSGLSPATIYHLRLVAGNEDGQSEAVAASTFETDAVGKPTVSIDPVTTFTGTTAHLSGSINPNAPGSDPSFRVNWHFECDPGCPGAEGPALGTANTPQGVEADALGLEPNTDYTVKLIAEGPGGSEEAGPVSFKTLATSPAALTIPAFVLEGGTSALVGGRVNPHNSASTWWVEYGTTTGYGQSLPASKDAAAGSGGQLQFQTQELTGLAHDTTYHYRIVAKDGTGETPGEDMTFTTPPAVGPPASCPNAALRTGPSAALPDCRAYENLIPLNLLGSQTFSASSHAISGTVADSGEAALWETNGSPPGFDASGHGGVYLSKRTPSGWQSTLASLPGHMSPWYASFLVYATPNFDRLIWSTENVVNPEDPDPTGPGTPHYDLYRQEADGSFVWLTRGSDMGPDLSFPNFNAGGTSADALKVFFTDDRRYEPDAPNGGLYMRSGQTTTVIKDENGVPIAQPGGSRISADGSVVAIGTLNGFYAYRQDLGHAVFVAGNPNGAASLISISADGSRILFATPESLAPDDDDSASDIYAYEVGSGDFERLSGTSAGPGPGNGEADARPVLASPDASTVYFTSTEQLDGDKGVSGATNLYRAEGGAIHYATTLSGPLQDPTSNGRNARLTRDGKKLLFESPDRLTAYDNEGKTEIYAYDSPDGSLICASCRPNGEEPSGDAGFGDKGAIWGADQHGEQIFFQSTDEVLPQDVNGKPDVYEFTASTNTTSLISTGQSPASSLLAGNSADGRDVFFFSVDSLTPSNQNVGARKLFDARIGGGFAEAPPPAVCEGEGCRGQGPSKPADVAPATPGFSGPGNPKPPKKPRKHKHKSHKKHQSKSHKKHQSKSHKKHQSKSHKRAADDNGRTGR